jgi:hypothetical protein
MLQDARTAGLVKGHCGKGLTDERQQWANIVENNVILWSLFLSGCSALSEFELRFMVQHCPHWTYNFPLRSAGR